MRHATWSLMFGVLYSVSACSKNDGAPAAAEAATQAAGAGQGHAGAHQAQASAAPAMAQPPSAAPATPPLIPPRTGTKVDDVLDSYESVRVRLAADDFLGAKAAAEKLIAAAAEAAPADVNVQAIHDGAKKLQQAADMPAARMAFGDVSRATVALAVAKPELQTGRFLMMCPMAKGYQKWVQTDQALRNPYYGSEMLECGEQLKAWSL